MDSTETVANEKVAEGWAKPSNSKKYHWFGSDSRSLCQKWMFLGSILKEDQKSLTQTDHDCGACFKKRERVLK